jgi:predicted GNAT superfamily acetyltransferase
MGTIFIRAASRDDMAAIVRINVTGQPGVTPLPTAELEAIANGATQCLVAADSDQTIVGYLVAYHAADHYDGEEFVWFQQRYASFVYVDEIAVAADRQRQGIGGLLYQAIIAQVDVDALVCEVNLEPPNPGSLRFHTHLGFISVGQLQVSDGRLVQLLCLPLKLAAGRSPTSAPEA